MSRLTISGSPSVIRKLLAPEGISSLGLTPAPRPGSVRLPHRQRNPTQPGTQVPPPATTAQRIPFHHVFFPAIQSDLASEVFSFPLKMSDADKFRAHRDADTTLSNGVASLSLGPRSTEITRLDILNALNKCLPIASTPPIALGFPQKPSPTAGNSESATGCMTLSVLSKNDSSWSLDRLNELLAATGLNIVPTSAATIEELVPGGLSTHLGVACSISVRVSGARTGTESNIVAALQESVRAGLLCVPSGPELLESSMVDVAHTPNHYCKLWDALRSNAVVKEFAASSSPEAYISVTSSRLTGPRGRDAHSDWIATVSSSDPALLTATMAHSIKNYVKNLDATYDGDRVGLGNPYIVHLDDGSTVSVTLTPEDPATRNQRIPDICHLCGMNQSDHRRGGVNPSISIGQLAAALELTTARANEILGGDFAGKPIHEIPPAIAARACKNSFQHSAIATVHTLQNLWAYKIAHLADDPQAAKWTPPESPLVLACRAERLLRYDCLFQPCRTNSAIPAVGACNKCGNLGHVSSLCRSDAATVKKLLEPFQLQAQTLPAEIVANAAPHGRATVDRIRELLLTASRIVSELPVPSQPLPPPLNPQAAFDTAELVQLRSQVAALIAAAATVPPPTAPLLPTVQAAADTAELVQLRSQVSALSTATSLQASTREAAFRVELNSLQRTAAEEIAKATAANKATLEELSRAHISIESLSKQASASNVASAAGAKAAGAALEQDLFDQGVALQEAQLAQKREVTASSTLRHNHASEIATLTLSLQQLRSELVVATAAAAAAKSLKAPAGKPAAAAAATAPSHVAGSKRASVAVDNSATGSLFTRRTAPQPANMVLSVRSPLLYVSTTLASSQGSVFSANEVHNQVLRQFVGDNHAGIVEAALYRPSGGPESPGRKAAFLRNISIDMMSLPESVMDRLFHDLRLFDDQMLRSLVAVYQSGAGKGMSESAIKQHLGILTGPFEVRQTMTEPLFRTGSAAAATRKPRHPSAALGSRSRADSAAPLPSLPGSADADMDGVAL